MKEIFNVAGDGTSWTLLLSSIDINMISSPEKYEANELKTKSFIWGGGKCMFDVR